MLLSFAFCVLGGTVIIALVVKALTDRAVARILNPWGFK